MTYHRQNTSNYSRSNSQYNVGGYAVSGYSATYPEQQKVFLCRGTCATERGCTCGRRNEE